MAGTHTTDVRVPRETVSTQTELAPAIAQPANIADLRPTNTLGFLFTLIAVSLTSLGIVLSCSSSWLVWSVGQVTLAFALLQWFAMIHEAGHRTLFRSSFANHWVGHMAGFFALIPFPCWKIVHARHHRWTGWQDMDTTTASLVPRKLRFWERWAVNVCWATGIPLFSVIYRVSNYWFYPRLVHWFEKAAQRRSLRWGVISYAAVYTTLIGLGVYWLGPATLLSLVGLPVLLTLMMQDPLILSQHTHIPMHLASQEEDVKPFAPLEQQPFTRSLVFPKWFSHWVLIHVDAHELHHMYPRVPGYFLDRVEGETTNAISWWKWLLCAKAVRGEILLFQNREVTGYRF